MNVVFMVFGGACGVLANIALEASSPSLSGKFGVVVFSIVLLSGLAAWRFGWVRERSRTLVVALAYLIVLVDMNAQGNRITI
jgi:hypothetical protein